jgi:hypothetical protein
VSYDTEGFRRIRKGCGEELGCRGKGDGIGRHKVEDGEQNRNRRKANGKIKIK